MAEDSITNADTFVARIDETFRLLAQQPRIGRRRPEVYPKVRSFVVGKYVIFYLPLRNGIDVVRVLHDARDIVAAFEEQKD